MCLIEVRYIIIDRVTGRFDAVVVSQFHQFSFRHLFRQVIWSLGVSARLGNKLTPTETTGKPSVSWTCDDREKYSLFLMDMDVLGQDNRLMDEGRLWFVANITDCNWYNGETVVDLLPPSPMYGSGEHRFVLLVYRQSNDVYYEEPFVDST